MSPARLSAPRRRRGLPRLRAGMTLVEVVAALFLLSVGLLAMAGLAVAASRSTRAGGTQTVAAALAQTRFDSLSSLPCAGLAASGTTSGGGTTRGIRERWAVTDGVNVKRLSDSLWIPGRPTAVVYLSVIPCRDL